MTTDFGKTKKEKKEEDENMSLKNFKLRKGSVPGHAHTKKGINNQDALFVDKVVIDGKLHIYGVVADGCSLGGKKVVHNQYVRTEVGSVLLTSFIRSEIPLLLASHMPVDLIPQGLYNRCVSYLSNIARTTVVGGPEVLWDFIERNLLATIVGFIVNEQTLIVFNAGDGLTVVNDEINAIDQDNKPSYLAYHLVDRTILGDAADQLPQCFDWTLHPTNDVNRFAVCTDGIIDAWKADPNAINAIWENQPQAPAGLQWWLNLGSKASLFRDDCTIIGARRISDDEN